MRTLRRTALITTALAMALVASLAAGQTADAEPRRAPTIDVVSSPSRYVSGGDARIIVTVPAGVDLARVIVSVGGVDVTSSLERASDPDRLEGVIAGLPLGRSSIVADVPGDRSMRRAIHRVVNHPISGPMFSGPHEEPFICETEAAGLGPAVDEDCFASTKVELQYMNTAGAFGPMPSDGTRPADLAQTTNSLGQTVDYVVRLETGVIDRAVYQTAVLYDPEAAEAGGGATPAWNQRLVYTFGGGCNAGHHQGRGNGGVLSDIHLSKGYGVASSSLNVLNNNCNDVLSAEAALMVKERFIESYGKPLHTIGWGGSGGAIQQHLIAQNYPGIVDGIVPTLSYPDATTIFPGITDCRLFYNFFDDTWDTAARDAVVGYDSYNNCLAWEFTFANRIDATAGCEPVIPEELIYDPVTNPDGVRCAFTDHLINILGVDRHTGNAPTLHDNVGVQYGLAALNDGAITIDQFLDLNAAIGGFDTDGVVWTERSVATRTGLRQAYRTGRIVTGEGLATVPILDFRPYLESSGDIHDRFRSFSMRQRLTEANGNADNQVIWIVGDFVAWIGMLPEALAVMDEWLTNLDPIGDGPTAADIVAAKPSGLVDTCWAPDGTRTEEPAVFGDPNTTCNQLYPNNVDPRIVAGEQLASDTMKCRRKGPDADDYVLHFDSSQWKRLKQIFPTGVCDYGRPGIGQSRWLGPWQDFGD